MTDIVYLGMLARHFCLAAGAQFEKNSDQIYNFLNALNDAEKKEFDALAALLEALGTPNDIPGWTPSTDKENETLIAQTFLKYAEILATGLDRSPDIDKSLFFPPGQLRNLDNAKSLENDNALHLAGFFQPSPQAL